MFCQMSYLELSVCEIIESAIYYFQTKNIVGQMSYLELSVCEIIEGAVIQTLKDKVKLLIRRHPRAEPIFSGNLKQI